MCSTKLFKNRQRDTQPFFYLPLSTSFGSLCILGVKERGQILFLLDLFGFPEMRKDIRMHIDLSLRSGPI